VSCAMAEKQNFFSWYYGRGLGSFLELEKNWLVFLWRHFAIAELIFTLFYPWKRDLTGRYWRGFQPLKSLERLVDNLIARLIGAIVRLAVIFSGVLSVAAFLVLALILLFVWIFPPLIFSVLLFDLPVFYLGFFAWPPRCFLPRLLKLLMTAQTGPDLRQMSLAELARRDWFNRVWKRLGIENEKQVEGFSNPEKLAPLLKAEGVAPEEFGSVVNWEINFRREKENKGKFWLKENLEKVTPIGRQWKYAYTVNLDKYSLDLTFSDPTDYREKN
jgi:hypothetical protein